MTTTKRTSTASPLPLGGNYAHREKPSPIGGEIFTDPYSFACPFVGKPFASNFAGKLFSTLLVRKSTLPCHRDDESEWWAGWQRRSISSSDTYFSRGIFNPILQTNSLTTRILLYHRRARRRRGERNGEGEPQAHSVGESKFIV